MVFDAQTLGFLIIGLLLLMILVRIPIGIALIAASFVGLWTIVGWRVAWNSLGSLPYQFASSWVLSSVPTFLFMGYVCYHAKLTQGLFDAARVWLSGLPGGLAIASVFGCTGFAAVTGSSVACSAAMGKIAVPEMVQSRYDPELATGTVAAAGTIGALIPPSIIMILYGIIVQQPITPLFLGGIVIGLMTMVGYCLVIVIRVKLNPALAPSVDNTIPLSEKIAALRDTWPILLIFASVLGGLFSGLFTPTEAGAIGAFMSCVVAAMKGSLSVQAIRLAAGETLQTTAALLVITIGASLFTRFLALSGTGDLISSFVLSLGADQFVIILMIVALYLVLGLFLEPIGAMLLTLPVLLPILNEYQIGLIWFGVLLTKLLEVGMITPPIGMNIFVMKSVAGNLVTTSQLFRGVFWFIVADLVIIALMVAFPGLTINY